MFQTKIRKFIRKVDFSEIEDDDVFDELISSSSIKMLDLIAIEEKKSNLINYSGELSTKEINQKHKSLLDKIKFQQNDINSLKVILEDLELSEIRNDQENKNRLKELDEKYNELALRTVETKEFSESSYVKLKQELKDLMKKQNCLFQLADDLKRAELVDFCFLLDCTSSMSTYIEQVTETINQIMDYLTEKFKHFKMRLAFVGYKDFDVDERIIICPFLEDVDLFKMVLSQVNAEGGKDECEDVFGGLFECTKLDWVNQTRILFHFCDAPCHGRRFHNDDCEDLYPDGDPTGLRIDTILKKLNHLGINYFFAEINSKTEKMIQEFNTEFNGIKIRCLKLNQIESMSKLILESVMSTLSHMTKSIMNKRKLKERIINPHIPNWNNLTLFKKYKNDFFIVKNLANMSEIKSKVLNYEKSVCDIWIYNEPFSKGALRFAYASVLNLGDNTERCLLNCVVKESQFFDPSYNTKEFYEESLQPQLIAGYLAYKFSRIYKNEKKIRFLNIDLIRIHETGAYFTIEEFVEGIFKKWMNNEGNTNDEEYAEFLNAFSHWTYHFTNEYLIVTDLQGFIYKDKEYILTDPAIICPEDTNRFGLTNLRSEGVKIFFRNHECNRICKDLNLKEHLFQI